MNERNKELLEDKFAKPKGSKDKKFTKDKATKKTKSKNDRGSRTKKYGEDACTTTPQSALSDVHGNDPRWYAASEQLMKDAFSLSMPYQLGSGFTMTLPTSDPAQRPMKTFYAPGICALRVAPLPGLSVDGSSPVNLAAHKICAWVRHANSGHANYDPADLMMYILAMDNAYMLYNFLVRAYGVMRLYNQVNRYTPKVLVQAMHLDFDDLNANLANFRYKINYFANALASFAVPATLPYITRHQWLFRDIYTDEPDFKSQLYMFVPECLYKWNEKVITPGEATVPGYLSPVNIGGYTNPNNNNLLTYSEISQMIDDFLAPLVTSEDFNIMGGDIIKAYGLSNCLVIHEISEDYTVIPIPEETALKQIENCNCFERVVLTGNITQRADGAIICNPGLTLRDVDRRWYDILNFHQDIVTPEDVAEATRLLSVPHDTAGGFRGFGSELPVKTEYYTINPSSASGFDIVSLGDGQRVNLNGIPNLYRSICTISNFYRHPITAFYEFNTGTIDYADDCYGYFGNLDNYTFVEPNTVVKMHETALLSLFDVPQLAGT